MHVRVSGLTQVYGEQSAVDNLNFEVHPGEILGFLGPNGAGKTTTMKAITCFLQPTEGTITVGKYDTRAEPLEVRKHIGYLPEHNPLYLDMYVREFLDFIAKTHDMPAGLRASRIEKVIQDTGLSHESHKQIGSLSKGYRQRVGLCQAIIHDPAVLILDEPTSGLDPNQMADIRQLIRTLGENKTVIFSSHILSEVEAIADRVMIINRGKQVADSGDEGIDSLRPSEIRMHVRLAKEGMDMASLTALPVCKEAVQVDANRWVFTISDSEVFSEAFFHACVAQSHVIRELRPEERKLEDVFRALTV